MPAWASRPCSARATATSSTRGAPAGRPRSTSAPPERSSGPGTHVWLDGEPELPITDPLPASRSAPWPRASGPTRSTLLVAIVGTRSATPHGLADAREVAGTLVDAGVTVVMGWRSASTAPRTPVPSRPAGAPWAWWPPASTSSTRAATAALYRDVRAHGLVLGETGYGIGPAPWRFPVRNRIIAALADIVVVVEATLTGGARITAEHAVRYDRAVFAVPGSRRNPASAGTNALDRPRRVPLTEWSDVLVALGITPGARRAAPAAPRPTATDARARRAGASPRRRASRRPHRAGSRGGRCPRWPCSSAPDGSPGRRDWCGHSDRTRRTGLPADPALRGCGHTVAAMVNPTPRRGGILGDPIDDGAAAARALPVVPARPGLAVLHRKSRFVGTVIQASADDIVVRDARGAPAASATSRARSRSTARRSGSSSHRRPTRRTRRRHRRPGPRAPRRAGARRPTPAPRRGAAPSSARGPGWPAAARILVEGVHDAELVEHVWGDDLRIEGVVVERLDGADHLAAALAEIRPGPGRRVGVLLDHLVPGSKEARLAARSPAPHVLVTGTPYVDVWQAVRPAVVGIAAWPEIPKGTDWKTGVCAALGVDDPRRSGGASSASVSTGRTSSSRSSARSSS